MCVCLFFFLPYYGVVYLVCFGAVLFAPVIGTVLVGHNGVQPNASTVKICVFHVNKCCAIEHIADHCFKSLYYMQYNVYMFSNSYASEYFYFKLVN